MIDYYLRIGKKFWGNQENIAARKKRIGLSRSETFRNREKNDCYLRCQKRIDQFNKFVYND
jgi:hypothetical protein